MNMVTVTHISMLSPLTRHSRMRKKKKNLFVCFCLFLFSFSCYVLYKCKVDSECMQSKTLHCSRYQAEIDDEFTLQQREDEEDETSPTHETPNITSEEITASGSGRSGLFYSLSFPKCTEIVLRQKMGYFYNNPAVSARWNIVHYLFLFGCSIVALLCL